MLKFTAHLDMLLQDISVSKRISKFSEIGFKALELWCWWDYDIEELIKAGTSNDIEIAAICTKFISLTDPSCRQEYLDGLQETIDVCKKLGSKVIISQVGNELEGVDRDCQKESIIAGLKEAGKLLDSSGMVLTAEPLNILVNHAGYYLSRSDEAAEIISAVNSDSVKMLFDVYHQQITEGNVIANIKKYHPLIGHYHLADNPGRNEPGTGEINYHNVLKEIDAAGYDGYVGLEFVPTVDNENLLVEFRNSFKKYF